MIKRAQKGDGEAFLKIFQPYEGEIYRIAFIYLKNKDDALDVVQETAYRAFKYNKRDSNYTMINKQIYGTDRLMNDND
ncbi:helix-turn-helix domain-containing protein [Paranoxybacillus vitaminiphilus]|uniref:helix-turn-helix domain-containing protein n=1 Tax=Paranoxybacillus vitaminiphilus TaxID=581036 RepID=UPI00319DEDC2